MRKQSYFSYSAQRIKQSKPLFAIIMLFSLFYFASFIYFLVIGQARSAAISGVFLFIFPLIFALERWMKLQLVTPFLVGVLIISTGSLLGSGYDLYTLVPCFDDILHCISGFIFACLGFALLEVFIGKPETKRNFGACLLFGFVFSLAIAVLWELFEYFGTWALGLDMQEDTIVYGFNSFLLSGTHSEAMTVDGITQTIIHFANGKTVTIDGYLDLGLIDTIADMAICFFGAIVYVVAIAIDWAKKKVLFRAFIPRLIQPEENMELEYVPVAACAADELCDATDSE